LRLKGRAAISADPTLTASFAIDGKNPRTVIIVTVESVYYHCAKAIHRSRLWDASTHVDRSSLPGTNAILAAIQWRRCRNAMQIGRRLADPAPLLDPRADEPGPVPIAQ
jgi:hypothetical protein